MDIFDSLGRLMGGFFAVVGLIAYLVWKWKLAGDQADTMAAERSAARQSFDLLKQDPRFHHLWQYIAPRHRATFEHPPDGQTYRIRYLCLTDAVGQPVYAHQGGPARYLMAYLEREASPARLRVSLDLATGTCGEVEMNWLTWSSSIPAMY